MDIGEKIKEAWRKELKSEIPEALLGRLECKTGEQSDSASPEVEIQSLESAKNKTQDSIRQLSKELKNEEIFLEIVSTELDFVRLNKEQKEPVNLDAMYAKVNKLSKRKKSEPLGLKVQTLSSSSQPEAEYEEVIFPSHGNSSATVSVATAVVTKKSLRGSVKDKIRKFELEESDSSSSEDSGAFEGDYASIKPSATVAAKPQIVRKPRSNEYEEIDLPFLSEPKPQTDTAAAESKTEDVNKPQTIDMAAVSRNQSFVHNKQEGTVSSCHPDPASTGHNPPDNSPKPNRPPVPIRRGKSSASSRMTDGDSLKKVEASTLKQSDHEPQLSASMKKATTAHHDIKISARAHVIHVDKSLDGSDDDMEGDYCSISELKLPDTKNSKHTPVNTEVVNNDQGNPVRQLSDESSQQNSDVDRKNVTVLTVSYPDKYKSRSTENLSKIRQDNETGLGEKGKKYMSKSHDCLNDIDTEELNDVTVGDSAEMKKLFQRKEGAGDITVEKPGNNLESQNDAVVATGYKSLASSGSDEDMMKTIQVDLLKTGVSGELLCDGDDMVISTGRDRRDKHDRVPDYEKWNFQKLLTQTGISVVENDNTDTGSEDDNIYDNVEQPETVSGQSDDSGVCETTTPDSQKRSVHVETTDEPGPEIRSDDTTTDPDARHSNASCLTIDGGPQILQRTYSDASSVYPTTLVSTDDEDRFASIDEDSFSVCSVDDQLDKADFEETLRADESSKQRTEQLHMRHLVVKGILESEKSYLHVVDQLIKAKHYLQTSCMKPGSGIALEDVTTIFYKLEDIAKIHQEFIAEVEKKVNHWTDDECIADPVKRLVFYFKAYEDYVDNYPSAISTIQKYQRNEDTKQLLEKMFAGRLRSDSVTSVPSGEQLEGYKDDNIKLEDILLKPVQRIQTNNLVLHDLIKHTPEDHPDYLPLKKALKLSEQNLKTYNDQPNMSSNSTKEGRHFVKSGFMVEVSRDKKMSRQLRYVFLFSDLLVCTKHKGSSKQKEVSFKYVWSLPLPTLTMHMKDEQKYALKESLDVLKNKIGAMKCELRDEMRKEDTLKEKGMMSISKSRVHRTIEKLKKKIQEQEAMLVEALPRLPLNLQAESFRQHTFLFPTDYEREEWREALESHKSKCSGASPPQLSNHDLEGLIESTKLHTQVNGIGTVLLKKDEEMLNGNLNVTIHKMHELDVITTKLDESCEVYCCLEMDSYGHFYKKAQTRLSKYVTDASWDQDFELDLDGSQTLRILCYKKTKDGEDDVIIGKCALELSLAWLNSKFNEKTVSMNEVSITISIRHTPASKTLKRTQSTLRTGIFGVNIEKVVRREGLTVPSIVTACVKQVEERGLEEVGIYRVSGVTSEVQHLKKLFDKNPIAAAAVAKDSDIHAITGVLKLYFRELPEPLFTDYHYQSFIQTIALQNEEGKEKCMLELLHSLPDGNYYTIIYMIEHLMRIAQHASVNKMSINNLSTIFGPTLLHPAMKETIQDPILQMVQAAKDASVQCEVVQFFIRLAMQGKNLRKSAMTEESSAL